MSTKTSQAKPVLVSVYVEGPKRRSSTTTSTSSSSKNGFHHHHHHHHHHHFHYVEKSIKDEWNLHKNVGKGYSRRAQLFHYSQSLRQSAKLQPQSSPLEAKLISSNHHQDSANNVAVQRQPKYSKRSTCRGNWRIFFPKFCRSLSSLEAKKDLKKKNVENAKNSKKATKDHLQQQQKKRRYIWKLLPTYGKNQVKYKG